MSTAGTRALLFRNALILYISAVAYLCFANFNSLPDVPRKFLGLEMDKIVHFCMFFPFPAMGFLAYGKKTESKAGSVALMITICSLGCIFAGLTELIQGMMPYRTEDIRDYRADVMAIALSSLITLFADIARHHR